MSRALLIACCGLLGCSFDPGGSDTADANTVAGDDAEDCSVSDAIDEFSATTNPGPAGLWQYGFADGLAGTLTLFDIQALAFELEVWSSSIGPDPNVLKNPTTALIRIPNLDIDYLPEFLHIHPGPNSEVAMVRWTAPTAGTYRVDTEFVSLNRNPGATTTVHVVHNGSSVFDGEVMGPDATDDSSTMLDISVGDTIDVAVTDGGNGHGSDSTGVKAAIHSESCGASP